jgi:hypothetical protein
METHSAISVIFQKLLQLTRRLVMLHVLWRARSYGNDVMAKKTIATKALQNLFFQKNVPVGVTSHRIAYEEPCKKFQVPGFTPQHCYKKADALQGRVLLASKMD